MHVLFGYDWCESANEGADQKFKVFDETISVSKPRHFSLIKYYNLYTLVFFINIYIKRVS